MKLIVAVIRPFLIDRLIVALENVEGFPGMTVTDAVGFGQRVMDFTSQIDPLKPNKRIEIVADNEIAEKVLPIIKGFSHTGKKGDGVIFVLPVEQMILI